MPGPTRVRVSGTVSTQVRRRGPARYPIQYPMASEPSVPQHTGPRQPSDARHPSPYVSGPSAARAWAGTRLASAVAHEWPPARRWGRPSKPVPLSVPSPRQSDQVCRPRPARATASRSPVAVSLVGRLAGTVATFRLATAARLGNYYAEGISKKKKPSRQLQE